MTAMLEIPIHLSHQVDNYSGIVECSVPFPVGTLTELGQLMLHNNGQAVDMSVRALNYWHDSSIKWLRLSYLPPQSDVTQLLLILHNTAAIKSQPVSQPISQPVSQPTNKIDYQLSADALQIHSDKFDLSINLASLELFEKLSWGKGEVPVKKGIVKLIDRHNVLLLPEVTGVKIDESVCPRQNICTALSVQIDGKFSGISDTLNFGILLHLYAHSPSITAEFSLHNPAAAIHPHGHWDLGDPASVLFKEFSFCMELAEDTVIACAADGQHWQQAQHSLSVTQFASAGKNWQSLVHVDANNEVTLEKVGYELSIDTQHQQVNGRASPVVSISRGEVALCAQIDKFWQNFPTAISVTKEQLNLGFLPMLDKGLQELQGGEMKTQSCQLDFTNAHSAHPKPGSKPLLSVTPEWIAKCNVLPWFAVSKAQSPLDQLLQQGLSGANNFFAKRETADEYGWRNFGDLYADHETDGYQGQAFFVSHYNNQYDPIYGFIRQFLSSGDPRWYELADDLAKHVKDIDIYHTDKDKAEYNGGLFWHTDHYLKAYTSSHRSYSRHHESNAYQDHAGGGGPGGQHCYTTGLMLHHCLTGSESSKQAVLTLANWITHVYEGSGTCLELLLAYKNRFMPGIKNHFSGQYPLDRGTGNYIIALLDCYELTAQEAYLQRAAQIIQHTISPVEDIAQRGLENVEACWFYTVLLQAVCRYLAIKESLNSLDSAFYYARDSLLHYARWMLEHEYPYLHKPDILEYPNHTWTAQELRKAHIFYGAYYYDPDHNQDYLDKGQYFTSYVGDTLASTETASYTRIQALLLQNHGYGEYYGNAAASTSFAPVSQQWPVPQYLHISYPKRFISLLCKRLLRLSPSKEINWLKFRLPKRSQ